MYTYSEMNSCRQVDLIDLQSTPYINYRFIFVCYEYLTKFVIIHAFQTERIEEGTYHLLDTFTTFRLPNILHSTMVQVLEWKQTS